MIIPVIRTIIADDEHLARKKLRVLLDSEPGVQVVAECQDGQQAVSAIQTHRPDLLLIDIRMPDIDGFQVLKQIAADEMPVVAYRRVHSRVPILAWKCLVRPLKRHANGTARSHSGALVSLDGRGRGR